MPNGILVILVIPAILALVFGAWVFYSMAADVSRREGSFFDIVGPDAVRLKIDPPE